MTDHAQSVVYRLDGHQEPMWQFYSMPDSVVGGAASMEEAQSSYREALKFSLDTNELPVIREYVEEEAEGLGIWIRTPLSWAEPFKPLARMFASWSDTERAWIERHCTAGGDPVIVPCRPDDLLGTYLSQMTPFDSLIVVAWTAFTDGSPFLLWLVIEGSQAATADLDGPPAPLQALGLTPETPMREVFLAAARRNGRLGALVQA